MDGVVRIPKSVFESQAPEPAAPTEVVATVRRVAKGRRPLRAQGQTVAGGTRPPASRNCTRAARARARSGAGSQRLNGPRPCAQVRRIDGTVEELKRVTPDNPNFQPRKPTPGAVKAVNKDEVSTHLSPALSPARAGPPRPRPRGSRTHCGTRRRACPCFPGAGAHRVSPAQGDASAGGAAEQGG